MRSEKVTRVRLELHAMQLRNVAGAFKGTSDPFAIVTLLANDPTEKPRVLGKTEVIKNNLSPRWTTNFELDYAFGANTRINVGVWDEIRKANNKPMGSAMFEVGEVLGARGNTKAKKLRNGGTLFARITRAPDKDLGMLKLRIRGIKLKNTENFFSKSDPFFEVSAKCEGAGGLTWQPVYRSKHIQNELNPSWKAFKVDVGRLCGGDLDKPIMIQLWDWEKSGKHRTMGGFETSVNQLLNNAQVSSRHTVAQGKVFTVLKKGKDSGKVEVTEAELEGYTSPAPNLPARPPPTDAGGFATGFTPASEQSAPPLPMQEAPARVPSLPPAMAPPVPVTEPQPPQTAGPTRPKFVDYLTGGCELELSVAIDFTGSNGDPRNPGTLHYRDPHGALNDYEKAITAVGSIIGRYDTDQQFPVFGFGAKYGGVIQQCFQIGGKSHLSGIGGILEGYRSVFQSGVVMSGPTTFAEVINYTAVMARSKHDEYRRIGKQSYSILLILTDGCISPQCLEHNKQAIRNASNAPLSIVIVGIGSADFTAMKDLDDFVDTASFHRDIVQFVEFNRHAHDRSSLTNETLDEIPDQLVDFFYGQGIHPLPPISGSQISLVADEPTEEDIDLTMDISPSGEIRMGSYHGKLYDDTKFGTMGDYGSVQPMAPPPPPAAPAAPRNFQVQVPAGVGPGTNLQIKHPGTGQTMIVTVPQGVGPGATFPVPF